MLEIARYEGRKRSRGAVVTTVAISLLAGLYLWMWPRIEASGVDFEEYLEAFPPALREMFGIQSLSTIEGFLAAELYAFVWVLLLGVYLAYAAASIVAGDVEAERMDVLLSLPVSRARLIGEKAAALLVPIAVTNVGTPIVLVAGLAAVDQSIALADLVAVHALSVPYLLACASVGLLASVATSRAAIAQRIGAGVVFGLFLVESIVAGTAYSWLGAPAPSRYYDPTAVLVESTYDLAGAAVLLAETALLFGIAVAWFRRRDVR